MRSAIFLLFGLLLMVPLFAGSHAEMLILEPLDSSKTPLEDRCCDHDTKKQPKAARAIPVKMDRPDYFGRQIVGVWYNTNYPFEREDQPEGTYLKYEFNADGSFTRIIGHDAFEAKEHGSWSFTGNGSAIVLETSNRVYEVKVKYLELDEMVLEQEVQVSDTKLCTPRKDFYFHKK